MGAASPRRLRNGTLYLLIMAYLSTHHLHFPEATPDGPWGVGGTPSSWYVVHKVTGQAKYIGRVRGKKINYFDRALKEAERRNTNKV